MFAVDKRYAEQGLGEEMLMDALYKSYNMSAQLGLNNVIVDAIDDEAKAFWMKYDFIPFRGLRYVLISSDGNYCRDF